MSECWIAGVDEAGRGPLAGPVCAAAVILDPARPIRGLRDSKQLSPERREELSHRIRERSLSWSIGWADVEEIDSLNILGATMLAMRRALCALQVQPWHVEVDGNCLPQLADRTFTLTAIVRGDDLVPAISAASILAKCARDALMPGIDTAYPGYLMQQHKGYATRQHMEALRRLGPSPQHRRSFAPVRESEKAFI